ncbi:MAG: transglutaminase-like domain-containing protein, partial [Acidimicrobiia bacterium]|nr:transglutaminase-like domain-containing protein [Acidimicrobiia bacterium]
RRGWAEPAAVAAALGSLLVGAIWVVAPETTRAGVPTGSSLDRLADLLRDGGWVLRDHAAPVPPTAGVLLLCMAGVGLAAALSDVLAFPLRSALGAVSPALAVFVVASTLTTSGPRVPATVAFLGAAAAFLALQHRRLRPDRGRRTATPISPTATSGGGRARRGPRSGTGLAAGLPLAVAAVTAGVLLGPLMPGARGDPWLDYRSGASGTATGYTTVSPLVDIKSRLLGMSDREVMTVRSQRAAYWRLVALDSFDGETWTLDADTRRGPSGAGDPPGSGACRAEYSGGPRGGRGVPAAADPVAVEGLTGVRVVPSSRTLVAPESVSGRTYVVWSEPPPTRPTAAQQAATAEPTPRELRSLLDLPGSFPADLRRRARRIVAGAGNPWEAAVRLEAFFLDGSFTYDLSVPPGHGDNAIREFLEERRGFCEQFAGTYAALARAAGLPARVAVGFTPGRRSGGRFHVTDGNAHAWPEVWFAGLGWVPFEPTPAGDAPGQPPGPRGDSPSTVPPEPSATTTTTTTTVASSTPAPSTPGDPGTDGGGASGPSGAARRLGPWFLAAGLLVTAGVFRKRAAAWWTRRRRRRAALPAASVTGAWHDVVDRLSGAGLPVGASLTPLEAAATARSMTLAPAVAGAVTELAHLVTEASFSTRPATPGDAARAWSAADRVRGGLGRRRRGGRGRVGA